jgi:haloalkane dehalogenase
VIEAVRTPDDRFRNLPGYGFEPHYLEVDGLRLHYVDEGQAEGPPIVFLHGEPTWSYLYRVTISGLSGAGRRVAPDLFGFGRSDKPTDRAFYTYDRHVASFTTFVERLDLTEITLVVHDWGGPIGLRFAVEHPERVARLLVLNTDVFAVSDRWPTPGFLRWRTFAERAGLGLPAGFVVQGATGTELPPDVVAAYDAPFPSAASKAGAAMFPLLVPVAEGDPGAEGLLRVRERLATWDKPALVCFGGADQVFTPDVAREVAALIPTAGEPEIVDSAAHFLPEDRGELLAERIRRFLSVAE